MGMRRNDANLSETDIRSPSSRQWTVRADTADRRLWLRRAPVCRELAQHQITHLGVASMPRPFEIVRTKLGGSYFLARLDGEDLSVKLDRLLPLARFLEQTGQVEERRYVSRRCLESLLIHPSRAIRVMQLGVQHAEIRVHLLRSSIPSSIAFSYELRASS